MLKPAGIVIAACSLITISACASFVEAHNHQLANRDAIEAANYELLREMEVKRRAEAEKKLAPEVNEWLYAAYPSSSYGDTQDRELNANFFTRLHRIKSEVNENYIVPTSQPSYKNRPPYVSLHEEIDWCNRRSYSSCRNLWRFQILAHDAFTIEVSDEVILRCLGNPYPSTTACMKLSAARDRAEKAWRSSFKKAGTMMTIPVAAYVIKDEGFGKETFKSERVQDFIYAGNLKAINDSVGYLESHVEECTSKVLEYGEVSLTTDDSCKVLAENKEFIAHIADRETLSVLVTRYNDEGLTFPRFHGHRLSASAVLFE